MPEGHYRLALDGRIHVLTKLMVEMFVRGREWTGTDDYNELMVTMVIAWGRASGNLFDTSSIAQVLGLPRTTVKRILDRLVKSGEFASRLEGRRRVHFRVRESLKGMRGAEYELMLVELDRMVRRSARTLSILDNSEPPDILNSG